MPRVNFLIFWFRLFPILHQSSLSSVLVRGPKESKANSIRAGYGLTENRPSWQRSENKLRSQCISQLCSLSGCWSLITTVAPASQTIYWPAAERNQSAFRCKATENIVRFKRRFVSSVTVVQRRAIKLKRICNETFLQWMSLYSRHNKNYTCAFITVQILSNRAIYYTIRDMRNKEMKLPSLQWYTYIYTVSGKNETNSVSGITLTNINI